MELKITLSAELAALLVEALCDRYLYASIFPDLSENPTDPLTYARDGIKTELLEIIKVFKLKDPRLTEFDVLEQLSGLTFDIQVVDNAK